MKGNNLQKLNRDDSRPIRLRWYDYDLKEFFTAGIAFYNGRYGDYTLKLNMGRGKANVRPVSYQDDQTRFRVEELKQENGRVIKDVIGSGYMDPSTNGSIHIKLGGCSDILILG